MAGKVLINGVGYDIKGGKCLVGGVGYNIKKGKCLIGGTGYDIKFDPETFEELFQTASIFTADGYDLTTSKGASVNMSEAVTGKTYYIWVSYGGVDMALYTYCDGILTFKYDYFPLTANRARLYQSGTTLYFSSEEPPTAPTTNLYNPRITVLEFQASEECVLSLLMIPIVKKTGRGNSSRSSAQISPDNASYLVVLYTTTLAVNKINSDGTLTNIFAADAINPSLTYILSSTRWYFCIDNGTYTNTAGVTMVTF